MNDLIILANTITHSNYNELRLSLRSLIKYGENYGHVYIIGFPDIPFLTNSDKLTYVPYYKSNDYYTKSVIEQVSTILNLYGDKLSNEFVISYDNLFFLDKIDFNNIPTRARSFDLLDRVSASNRYESSLAITSYGCKLNGCKSTSYETNTPIKYNKNELLKLMPTLINSCNIYTSALHLPSYYCNCVDPSFLGNVVIDDNNYFYQSIDSSGVLRDMVNSDNKLSMVMIASNVIMYGSLTTLYNLFPDRCEFEND